LMNKFGKVIDQVIYDIKAPWPVLQNTQQGITLSRYDVDNHFGEYWKAEALISGLNSPSVNNQIQLKIYPNPATDKLMIEGHFEANTQVELYSAVGQLVKRIEAVEAGHVTFDVSDMNAGIYMIKVGSQTAIVLIKR